MAKSLKECKQYLLSILKDMLQLWEVVLGVAVKKKKKRWKLEGLAEANEFR